MSKFYLSLALLCLFCSAVYAQDRKISGQVSDAKNGETLIGVTVQVKGTSRGTSTDANGKFSLSIPANISNPILLLNYVGFLKQEVKVGTQSNLNIKMTAEQNDLNEVVVVGYGTVKKRDLTGSVVSIKGDEIAKVPSANPLESIQGKVPGVDITRSSGAASSGVNINIRGTRSITAGNGPLIIVDGVQYSSIQDINPNDIASMDILKDASSTAIYGSRGANGVILITTKKGISGEATISLNSYYGVSKVSRYPSVMDAQQYIALKREANRNTGTWKSPADDASIFSTAEFNAIQNNQFLDYQDLLFHDGHQQDHQIGVRAGTEKTKVYFSLDYMNEKGVLKKDKSDRYSARLNVDQSIGKIFTTGLQAQFTHYEQENRRDPLNQANKVPPLGTIYDDAGSFMFYPLFGTFVNPLADEQPDIYTSESVINRTILSAYMELKPIEGLVIRSNLGANLNTDRLGTYADRYSLDRNGSNPKATYAASNGHLINIENFVTYNKQIKEHAFTLTGINSMLFNRADNVSASGENQLLKSQLFYGLGNTINQAVSTAYTMNNLLSFAGRLNYAYKGKYLLTLTGRTDGSSKLAEGNKWAFFPSGAIAWRVSDEKFLKDNEVISDLKLKYSYGIAGSDNISPYSTESSLSKIAFAYDDAAAPAYTYTPRTGNKQLSWEKTKTSDFGLEISFLKNRISATVDYYDSKTYDLLLNRSLPPSTGNGSVIQNVAKTGNRGLEIYIASKNILSENFQWTTSLSFSRNKERIIELAGGAQADVLNNWFVGSPIQSFYDYEKIGIWQADQAAEALKYGQKPGDIRVRDLNDDGKIDGTNDRKILGTNRPSWSGGLENTFTYKAWDLNIYVYARMGQMLYADFLRRYDPQGVNNSSTIIDYWTPENPTNAYPRPNKNTSLASTLYSSSLGYEDGSFLRVRNITLGYSIPKQTLEKSFVKSLRLYFTARNPLTYTKSSLLKEYDPERGGSEGAPMTKLYTFGLNASF
ncbi:SusC/RagA family TonB-linked outer membrane protein [Pedobacter sp. PACM 27299]|uniref:SusC/RagA family TonB-linked outer membrane protein n=1 Tax=Pedobacter sp. PACM 27299 TaxID=1727164 RepID=UPI0007062E0A|nr:TonB-dependent receptor [Pedobacter sp. PACM 27299]ALL06132.1 SusC/RagA family TonB-linked outer membrane protein [Pedobacter sp. PACM 27299]